MFGIQNSRFEVIYVFLYLFYLLSIFNLKTPNPQIQIPKSSEHHVCAKNISDLGV